MCVTALILVYRASRRCFCWKRSHHFSGMSFFFSSHPTFHQSPHLHTYLFCLLLLFFPQIQCSFFYIYNIMFQSIHAHLSHTLGSIHFKCHDLPGSNISLFSISVSIFYFSSAPHFVLYVGAALGSEYDMQMNLLH